jgi:hypothetical protein
VAAARQHRALATYAHRAALLVKESADKPWSLPGKLRGLLKDWYDEVYGRRASIHAQPVSYTDQRTGARGLKAFRPVAWAALRAQQPALPELELKPPPAPPPPPDPRRRRGSVFVRVFSIESPGAKVRRLGRGVRGRAP